MADDGTFAGRIIALGPERLAGMTAREIGAKVGCCHVYAATVMRRAGLMWKPGRRGPLGRNLAARIEPYLDSGLSYQAIAGAVGTTRASVGTYFARLRRLREAREGRQT